MSIKKYLRPIIKKINYCRIISKLRIGRKLVLIDDCRLLEKKYKKKKVRCYDLNRKSKKKCIDLSLIVPLYNVDGFIDKLIPSLVGQRTEYKYEIILVNDGSKDGTTKKCKNT